MRSLRGIGGNRFVTIVNMEVRIMGLDKGYIKRAAKVWKGDCKEEKVVGLSPTRSFKRKDDPIVVEEPIVSVNRSIILRRRAGKATKDEKQTKI